MSWFSIIKQGFKMPKSPQTHADRLWQEMLQERGEKDLTKPKQFLTSTPRTVEDIGGFNPTQVKERKQRLENEQRKIEEAWAEKQRELEKRRTQLGPEMQELNNALNVGKQKVKEVLEEIKQKRLQNLTQDLDKIALQRKLDEAKNALKQYPMLSDMLGHLEAVENMAQGA
jgi:predicted  nucleic acid-binding Zn-ribbon protein